MNASQTRLVRRSVGSALACLTCGLAHAGDGIVFPDDFDYSKGYSMSAASDGGGYSATIDKTFFTKAVWKESAEGSLVPAQAGKNYFQNGYLLNGPNVSSMTAAEASPYLTFPGNKLVLGSGTKGSLDQHRFDVFNGSTAMGEEGLANASTKPYLFGGDGLFMAGNCQIWMARHGAIAGTLTVLSDDHDDYRVSATNTTGVLTDNNERFTRAQCSCLVANDNTSGWSMDVQANLVGSAESFLACQRTAFTAGGARRNVFVISGSDNSRYLGTLAVETNCVLRFKTSLVNGKVKVGYRGWGLPVKTGTEGTRPYTWADFDPQATGMGYLEVPTGTAVTIADVENHNGTVQVQDGATLTVDSLTYRGGLFEIASTGAGRGKIVVNSSFVAAQLPIRIAIAGELPAGSCDILSFPATSGLALSDFAVSGGVATLSTANGVTTLCVTDGLAAGEQITVADASFSDNVLKLAVSPTPGNSASMTVSGTLSVQGRPVRLALTGDGSQMPQGELVKLFSWRTADNPALDVCDFDFSALGEHDNFGPAGIGRGYPVLKTENGMTTLYLDCAEILKTAADADPDGFKAENTCFRNGDKWADGNLPHLDANYFTNGKLSCAPGDLSAMQFPDGVLVPGREFHGNRIRVGNNTKMQIEKAGKEAVNFAQDGLVLQQGGKIRFCDPNIVVTGRVHCASLQGAWTMSSEANRSGCENASSTGDTSSRFVADFTSDRCADFTVFISSWLKKPNRFTCTFDGDMSGFLGTLVCERQCCIALNRDLPNGTVKLGWTGLPSAALGSLDNCTNGWLSASCTGKNLSISNLVVNGAKVTVENGNTYALRALTLNGGLLDVSARETTETQFAVDGPVEVTHETLIALERRPRSRTPLKLISWPTAQPTPDTSLLTLVRSDGSSWGAECSLQVETDGAVTYLMARSPEKGMAFIVR